MDATLGFFSIVIATLLVFFFFLRNFTSPSPPGPIPFPIIGNFHLIDFLFPHQSLHKLSHKYGPIMQVYFGSVSVVIGSSAEIAEQFLKIHDHKFASRPRSNAGFYTNYDHTTMTWSPYGPHWRNIRKIFVRDLFNTKRVESYAYIREEESRAFVSLLHSSCGKPIVIKNHFLDLFFTNMTRMILGKKFSGESALNFKSMLDEWFFLNGVLHFGDYIPWIRFLDLQGHLKRMKAVQKKMDNFLEQQVNEHLTKKNDSANASTSNDLLDVLLHLTNSIKLSHENVKSLTWEMLGGISTTTIEWAMSEMLRRKETFEQATKELDIVIGKDRQVEEKDLPNLLYMKCILYETMRLHPVSPLLSPHFSLEKCEVNGYEIFEGTQILVNVWSIGRDPKVWAAPNEFRPERFVGSRIDVNGKHFELLPFGSGRRMCPAYSLGFKLTMLALAKTLHGFTFQLENAMKPENLSMEEEWGLTVSRKIPLVVVAQPRLPVHVYSA